MATTWQNIVTVSSSSINFKNTDLYCTQTTQAELRVKVPEEWLLPESMLSLKPRNVIPLLKGCGLLTARELGVADIKDAVALLEKIHSKEWSAFEVTVAFCKRAAIAQQMLEGD